MTPGNVSGSGLVVQSTFVNKDLCSNWLSQPETDEKYKNSADFIEYRGHGSYGDFSNDNSNDLGTSANDSTDDIRLFKGVVYAASLSLPLWAIIIFGLRSLF